MRGEVRRAPGRGGRARGASRRSGRARGARLVALAALVALLGCDGPQVEGEPPLGNAVVARVNGRALRLEEVERVLSAQPAVASGTVSDARSLEAFFQDLVRFEVLYQEAARRGLASDPRLQADLRAALAGALLEVVGREALDASGLDEATLRAAYEADPARYAQPAQATFIQLFSRDPRRLRLLEVAEAMLRAGAQPAGVARGRVFESLARRWSEGRGATVQVGPVGLDDDGLLAPRALVEAALGLEAGAVSAPIATPDGVYRLLVTGREPAAPRRFEAARAEVQRDVIEARRAAARRALIERLRREAEVRVLDPDLARALEERQEE